MRQSYDTSRWELPQTSDDIAKRGSRKFILLYIYFYFVLATAIGAIVTYFLDKPCDHHGIGGINISSYLLGYGIIFTLMILFHLIMAYFIASHSPYSKLRRITLSIICVLSMLGYLVSIAWIVIGSVVMFRSNMDCIKHYDPYALSSLGGIALSIVTTILLIMNKQW